MVSLSGSVTAVNSRASSRRVSTIRCSGTVAMTSPRRGRCRSRRWSWTAPRPVRHHPPARFRPAPVCCRGGAGGAGQRASRGRGPSSCVPFPGRGDRRVEGNECMLDADGAGDAVGVQDRTAGETPCAENTTNPRPAPRPTPPRTPHPATPDQRPHECCARSAYAHTPADPTEPTSAPLSRPHVPPPHTTTAATPTSPSGTTTEPRTTDTPARHNSPSTRTATGHDTTRPPGRRNSSATSTTPGINRPISAA